MHGDGVAPDGTPPPCHAPHAETYTVTVALHPDGQVCVTVARPAHRTDDEAREVLAMVGELSAVSDVAVTPSGLMVEVQR
jgi:hypothetical protein